ncbi:hypothetical protein ACOMHN_021913 [Nucella lapillus]
MRAEDCEELTRNVHVTSKVMVVGDGEVGKTSLLIRYVHDQYLEEYRPTIFENQAVPVNVKNKKVLLSLFDTAGQEGYDFLRPLMYPDTDIVLICFSVNDRSSLSNVISRWQPEVRFHLSKIPILLVGLKTDLRNANGSVGLSQEVTSSLLASQPLIGGDVCLELRDKRFVSYSEGQKMAEKIGAKAYFECSSKVNQGLTSIFFEAAQLSLKHRRGSSIRRVLRMSTRARSFWRAA